MNNFPILIIGWKRPRCLYVTLQGLFQARGIEDHDVYVYIDGKGKKENEIKSYISEFPIQELFIRKLRSNNLLHLMSSISDVFSKKEYKELFWLDNDHLISRDALQYLKGVKRDSFFYSLQKNKDSRKQSYSPRGNLVSRKNFDELCTYVLIERDYVGKKRPLHDDQILTANDTGHDKIFFRFLIDREQYTRFSPRCRLSHFGVGGVHTHEKTRIFKGSKNQWLQEVIEMAENPPNLQGLFQKGFVF